MIEIPSPIKNYLINLFDIKKDNTYIDTEKGEQRFFPIKEIIIQ
jgi:hypothetical protein